MEELLEIAFGPVGLIVAIMCIVPPGRRALKDAMRLAIRGGLEVKQSFDDAYHEASAEFNEKHSDNGSSRKAKSKTH